MEFCVLRYPGIEIEKDMPISRLAAGVLVFLRKGRNSRSGRRIFHFVVWNWIGLDWYAAIEQFPLWAELGKALGTELESGLEARLLVCMN